MVWHSQVCPEPVVSVAHLSRRFSNHKLKGDFMAPHLSDVIGFVTALGAAFYKTFQLPPGALLPGTVFLSTSNFLKYTRSCIHVHVRTQAPSWLDYPRAYA